MPSGVLSRGKAVVNAREQVLLKHPSRPVPQINAFSAKLFITLGYCAGLGRGLVNFPQSGWYRAVFHICFLHRTVNKSNTSTLCVDRHLVHWVKESGRNFWNNNSSLGVLVKKCHLWINVTHVDCQWMCCTHQEHGRDYSGQC